MFKVTWFAEMDYLMAQGVFVYADGSSAGVSGYTATRDMLMNNWEAEIQAYGDSIEYHHHFMIHNSTWQRYDQGPDDGYPGYQMDALDHMIIDRNYYPSTFRSGWLIMPTALSNWLEEWMPFDYTPDSGIWYPTHPVSNMSRWQTRCSGAAYQSVDEAYQRAREYGSAIYSFCMHDRDDMANVVDTVQRYLERADADEASYPNVSFKYVSAREAMQRALGFSDFSPPTFTLTAGDGQYTIASDEFLWKNHPYVALKYANGTYMHVMAIPAGTNTWTVSLPSLPERIGVAASDLYGNPGVSTVELTNPTALLSPSTGPTGTAVSVTGSGWSTADVSVSFADAGLFDGTKTCAVSGGNIVSGCGFTVKPDALGGTYYLTFTGTEGDSAQAQFVVTSVMSFAGYPYMFIVGGAATGTVAVGASDTHPPCGMAHTIDVVGTNLIVMGLGHYADTGGLGSMLDYQAAHWTGSGIVLDVAGNIITAGGPGVNYVWTYYNDLETLPAYFASGAVYVPSTVHSYSMINDYFQGEPVTDYAIVELYADGGRNVLLVAGISGFATYYASDWLQQKTVDGTIQQYDAQAIILKLYDADGDPISTPPTVTVMEQV